MDQKQLDTLPGLVELSNKINSMKSWSAMQTARDNHHNELCELLGTMEQVSTRILPYVDLHQQYTQQLLNCKAEIDSIKNSIDAEIKIIADIVSHPAYCYDKLKITPATRQNFVLTDLLMDELVVRTGLPDIWKYPTCCINVQALQVVEQVMAGDTVYLVDVESELLSAAVANFTPAVQQRTRTHQIDNWHDLTFEQYISNTPNRNRWGLPKQQMALVVVYGIFERYNLGAIDDALPKLKQLLRAGGKLLFTVNNADCAGGAGNVVVGANGYVTHSALVEVVAKHGLELTAWKYITNQDFVLVEVTAPGPLQSSKYQPSRSANKKA